MSNLDELESKSIYIIREAYKRFGNIAMLWSIGKDSSTLLWLCRKAFFGKIPFPVIHIDTGCKFKEIYEFRDKIVKEWNLNLIISKNEEALKNGMAPAKGKFECCNSLKTEALKQTLKKYNFDALLLAIRRDEHGIRAKEHYFSPRDSQFKWNITREKTANEKNSGDAPFEAMQDTELSGWNLYATDFKDAHHIRIHPLLHWTELEIWEYIKKENILVVSLYFAKDSKRYRSIGCECCCSPVASDAETIDKIIEELKTTKVRERDGRAQDKEDEYTMQKLRSLGYM